VRIKKRTKLQISMIPYLKTLNPKRQSQPSSNYNINQPNYIHTNQRPESSPKKTILNKFNKQMQKTNTKAKIITII
jgi:hypothetical protein